MNVLLFQLLIERVVHQIIVILQYADEILVLLRIADPLQFVQDQFLRLDYRQCAYTGIANNAEAKILPILPC